MNIDLCFHIFKFEKRFRYVLSSLNQQLDNPFNMSIKVASHKTEDNFKHILDLMPKAFPKLNIKINEYTDNRFNIRGHTRTDNIKNCNSEWILFLDGDNVFHPRFFNNLHKLLSELEQVNKTKVISIPRLTMDAKLAYSLVDKDTDYKNEVVNAYEKVANLKTKPSFGGRVTGAGYFQLIHVPTMRLMGIDTYVNGSYDTPILDKNIRYCTKSDVIFRKRFTGVYAIRDLPHLIHLNHNRRTLDKEYDFNKCN
jgi:hypothetical protein